MILIMGPSGSGKTTVSKELEKINCYIVPTYTTRLPRPSDDFTVCLNRDDFYKLLMKNAFIAYHSFDSKIGRVSYGIPTIEYENNRRPLSNFPPVIIATYEYMNDIIKYAKNHGDEPVFKVYLNVDRYTIIRKSSSDKSRGDSNIDLLNRLERDKDKNDKLLEMADLVIDNYRMKIPPQKIADTILTKYREYLNDLIKGGRTI